MYLGLMSQRKGDAHTRISHCFEMQRAPEPLPQANQEGNIVMFHRISFTLCLSALLAAPSPPQCRAKGHVHEINLRHLNESPFSILSLKLSEY
jgi:hypothetical protein